MESNNIFCPKCGKSNSAGTRFCKYCGYKFEQSETGTQGAPQSGSAQHSYVQQGGPQPNMGHQNNAQKKQPPKNLKKMIITGVAAAAAVVVIIFIVMYMNSPEQRMNRAIKAGNYNEAVEIYWDQAWNELLDGSSSELPESTVNEILNAIDKIIEDYEAGNKAISEAQNDLYTLQNFYDSQSRISVKTNSRLSYLYACSELNAGDYYYAIRDLQSVVDADAEFEEANSKLEEAKVSYKDSVLSEADSYLSSEDFDSARYSLEEALSVLGEDSDIQNKLSEVEQAYNSYQENLVNEEAKAYIDEVDRMIEEGEYEDAAEYLNDALSYYSGNSTALGYIEEKTAMLVSAIEEEARTLASGGLYDEALELLDKSMEEIGDSSLKSTYDELYDRMPITLENLTIVSSDHIEVDDDAVKDRWGNIYDGSVLFDLYYGDAFALYNLNNRFTSFTATAFVGNESRNDREISIYIYLDEELVYTQTDISEESAPINISLDVTGAVTMRIVVEDEDEYNRSHLFFGDSDFVKAAE